MWLMSVCAAQVTAHLLLIHLSIIGDIEFFSDMRITSSSVASDQMSYTPLPCASINPGPPWPRQVKVQRSMSMPPLPITLASLVVWKFHFFYKWTGKTKPQMQFWSVIYPSQFDPRLSDPYGSFFPASQHDDFKNWLNISSPSDRRNMIINQLFILLVSGASLIIFHSNDKILMNSTSNCCFLQFPRNNKPHYQCWTFCFHHYRALTPSLYTRPRCSLQSFHKLRNPSPWLYSGFTNITACSHPQC